jgi:DNA-binding winged helix-turn-helix (wHTH) protein
MRLRFGDCVLDTDLRELRRRGTLVPLLPKAFRLLEILVERRPQVVPQSELRGLLWPDGLLGGTRLARLVNELRVAVGDEARPGRVIRTAHRFGYAFCAVGIVETAAPAVETAHCAIQWGERLVPLSPGENVIGRAADAWMSVASSKVSRRHARIVVSDGRVVLEDLGSKNGTFLGGTRIAGPVDLKHGDGITIGSLLLIFRVSSGEPTRSSTSDDEPSGAR